MFKEYCCQRTDKCRFGFQKEVSPMTQFNNAIRSFVFKKYIGDENVEEYSLSLILTWHGHILSLKNDIITPEKEKVVFLSWKISEQIRTN